MGGTRGSGILSIAADVLGMGVVCGVRGIVRVCICLDLGCVGGEGVSG